MALPNPVIVVPGITASFLRDSYPLPPEIVWSVLEKNYERSALHPDSIGDATKQVLEAAQPSRITGDQLFEIAYRELVEELRFNLSARTEEPVPVYPFGYDWRQPLHLLEDALADFVDEVIERTKLMRHYHKDGYADAPKVNLVGHSMGGLVISGYLASHGGEGKIGKVVTLATPFQGSFEAVVKVTTGTANLGTAAPSSREREAARLTPALYSLMPSFRNGLDIDPALPTSLFDPGVWQPSILATIEQFIQRHGLDPRGRKQQAADIFKAMLTSARTHRRRTDGLKLADAGLGASDWLCVVGAGAPTRVHLKVDATGRNKVPEFVFSSSDRQDGWEQTDPKIRRLTGDGTVPFEGAVPKFLDLKNLICVTPQDYGYWELADAGLTKVAGFHGILPNMNMLHRLIVRHFKGGSDPHGSTWGRPAPGVAHADWDPAIPGLRNKQREDEAKATGGGLGAPGGEGGP